MVPEVCLHLIVTVCLQILWFHKEYFFKISGGEAAKDGDGFEVHYTQSKCLWKISTKGFIISSKYCSIIVNFFKIIIIIIGNNNNNIFFFNPQLDYFHLQIWNQYLF